MKSQRFNDEIYREHRAFISAPQALEAFDALATHALRLPGYEIEPTGHVGRKKSMRYLRNGSEYSFAFIVNRAHLLFYIRQPALRRKADAVRELRGTMAAKIQENPRGEVTIRIDDATDAARVMDSVFGVGSRRRASQAKIEPDPSSSNGALPATGDSTALFEKCVSDIDSAYRQLGHRLGWRFLTGPKATLSPGTAVALITLNPGGEWEPPEHPRASSEAGSSYRIEAWPGHHAGQAPLQRQIQALMQEVAKRVGFCGSEDEFLDRHVLTAHFVPFRSPRFESLAHPKESLAFAHSLWQKILKSWMPRIIITIDRKAFDGLSKILTARAGAKIVASEALPTGWGHYTGDIVQLSGLRSGELLTLIRLPHLSTFKLFSRPECGPHVAALLDRAVNCASVRHLGVPESL